MGQLQQTDCIECKKALKHWIEFQLVDEQGKPLAGMPYKLTSRNNKSVVRTGTTDGKGLLREEDLPPMPVTLSVTAQPLADEIVKRTPRAQTGEAHSPVKPTALLDGHEYQYITLGMISDGYPKIKGWEAQQLKDSEHFKNSSLTGLFVSKVNRKHMLEIKVIQKIESNCACNRDITLEELKQIAPRAPLKLLQDNLDAFNQGFKKYKITTCREKAHFFAQIHHETGGMRTVKEEGGENMWYNPWYGRGFIQLSLSENYKSYEKYIKEDVTSSPQARDKLLFPPHSVLSVFWFYERSSCIKFAKNDDFNKVTILINGGFTGYSDRLKQFKRIIKILKAEHLNQLLDGENFEFNRSAIYNHRINAFAWGVYHDPEQIKRKGTLKDKNEALNAYKRAKELITATPFNARESSKKIYKIEYRDILTYVNKRIIEIKGNKNG
ncbi:hypothetical protein WDV76_15610 [Xenorhabdus griffiniae]|uniref:glycoside hydrolase family 19 protein n=1 Tax=Xenorhabdus griffiniae TaxID=351672 RepID=UPI0030D40C12